MKKSALYVLFLVVAVAVSCSAGVQYELDYLVGMTSVDNDYAYAINDKGQVVGVSSDAGSHWHAVMWDNKGMTDLGFLAGGNYAYATGINNNGQVGGYADGGDLSEHAFLWENGVMTDCGYTYPASIINYGKKQNSKGQVVGTSGGRAVLWENGVMKDLNSLVSAPGWTLSVASDINESGQIVGYGEFNGMLIGYHNKFRAAFLLNPGPEPSSLLTLVCGLGGIGGMIWRRRK